MSITIAEHLRPFSHLPGTTTILSGSGHQIQIFPTLIRIFDLTQGNPVLLRDIHLIAAGPLDQFTVCNDLEKGRITVSGKSRKGWIRYHIISSSNMKQIRLLLIKAPKQGLAFCDNNKTQLLFEKEHLDILNPSEIFEPFLISLCDRLSFGCNKAQDWELIKRRGQTNEILPFIHRLGQLIPKQLNIFPDQGTFSLLKKCEYSVDDEKPEHKEEHWRRYLLGCFTNLLIPRIADDEHQGLIDAQSPIIEPISPLILLTQGSTLIRSLFVQQENHDVMILPSLFPSMHCGRLINVSLKGGMLSLEWTKKTIRRMEFVPNADHKWKFIFQKDVKSFRLQHDHRRKGERKSIQETLFLDKGIHYSFDNFQ